MEQNKNYNELTFTGGCPVKAWTKNVKIEQAALNQVANMSKLPFIKRWIALMPDVHMGIGATIGSVIPTDKAIVPAAVGVDLGCGVMSIRLNITANHLPDNLHAVRLAIEEAVPVGFGGVGQWQEKDIPTHITQIWNKNLDKVWGEIVKRHPKIEKGNTLNHLGTLGSGNHFIELCLDTENRVWIMLHSGSRGVGNRIGQYFINMAKEEMRINHTALPDRDLAYLREGSTSFDDYIMAVGWAQDFAKLNRAMMMENIVVALRKVLPPFQISENEAVDCHHNYVERERHFDEDVWITRKGAVRAGKGDMGIIPGSMGTKSFIVRGLGNPDSFMSCSHGAGRAMSRTQARLQFTVEDHIKATEGVECRKDIDVIDETPGAYKSIDDVMASQTDLVEVVHQLRQVLCVKG